MPTIANSIVEIKHCTFAKPPKVLVVIVNWNKREMLEPLLAELPAQLTACDADVVVVDNASTDGSQDMIRQKFPWVILLTHETNLGGTGGFNAGMRYGMESSRSYDYFWLLDNDVELTENALNGLLDAIETVPHTAVAGSTVLIIGDPEQVQEAGCNVNWKNGTLHSQGIGHISKLPPDSVWQVDYVAACSLLARTDAIREIGIWDPGYFLYWDDIDWGLRFNLNGWKVVVTTASQIRHDSFNNRRLSQAMSAFYLCVRNRLYCLYKLHTSRWFWPVTLFRAVASDIVYASNARHAGYSDKSEAVWAGIRAFLDMVMDKPPAELFRPITNNIPKQTEASTQFSAKIKKMMFLTGDNPQTSLQITKMLQEKYPNAQITTAVYADNPEPFEAVGLPNLQHWRLDSVMRRMKLHLIAALKFDSVVVTHFSTHLLAERLAPRLIIIHDDLSFCEIPRTFLSVLRRLCSRPLIWLQALRVVLAVLFTRKRLPISHHAYKPFEQPTNTMQPGDIWDKWKQFRAHSIAYRVARNTVGILLLPIALLFVWIPFLFVPLLWWIEQCKSERSGTKN